MDAARKLSGILLLALAQWVGSGRSSVLQGADNLDRPSLTIQGRYSGAWVTTKNKKLDGTANCDVKQISKDRWQGKFWGVWQHVPFDYTVEFAPDKTKNVTGERGGHDAPNIKLTANATETTVAGAATIDGAHYDWTGTLTPKEFNIQFTGSRYEGHMELVRVDDKKSSP
jgi:hypothetical protein